MSNDKDYNKMIHTTRWLKLRRAKLSAQPLCEDCAADGYITPATEVHHVISVESAFTRRDKERLMFDYNNLRALCHDCHVKAHVRLGRGGKEAAKARKEEQVKKINKKFYGDGGGIF